MDTIAVVLTAPERLALSRLDLTPPGDDDVVVDIEWSGISAGTERLLWLGRMPAFPGMGYPLVPGYESVGRVSGAGSRSRAQIGERVFVPGARCFGPVRGLFGGAAARVVVPQGKVVPIGERLGEQGVLLALAATAHHAMSAPGAGIPDLIIGHGVLGRLLARLSVLAGGSPIVWERDARRRGGAVGYDVIDPESDGRHDYRAIYDVSGDRDILDTLVARLGSTGEIVLAGFYDRLSFAFAPVFMREARIRIAAEWRPDDLTAVHQLIAQDRLSLSDLITHRKPAGDAPSAYQTAFSDPACLKMILDWRHSA